MVIDKKLFLLCIVIIFVLSAMLGVTYTQQQRGNNAVAQFVKQVKEAQNDSQVLKLTDQFVANYETTISLSQSHAGSISRIPTTFRSPTPVPVFSPKAFPTPVYTAYVGDCADGSSLCITSILPAIIAQPNIRKTSVTITGQGFTGRDVILFCQSGKPCNSAVNSGDIKFISSTQLSFTLSDYFQYLCTARDQACLNGFAKGIPTAPGKYMVHVENAGGKTNEVSFTISSKGTSATDSGI